MPKRLHMGTSQLRGKRGKRQVSGLLSQAGPKEANLLLLFKRYTGTNLAPGKTIKKAREKRKALP